MTKAQLVIYTTFIMLEIIGVSTLVEIYKKQIRKSQSKVWENNILGLVLSVIAVIILIELNIFQPILGQIGAPILGDYVFYCVCFYALQLKADMVIVKSLIKACLKTLLLTYGFTKEQINDILSGVNQANK